MYLHICFKMINKHKKRCQKQKRKLFTKREKKCLMVILKRSKILMKLT